MKVKVVRKINAMWKACQKMPKDFKDRYPKSIMEPIGKWQYFYSSPLGEISMIELQDDLMGYKWEIYSYDILFKDVMRFRTKFNAIKKIKEILG